MAPKDLMLSNTIFHEAQIFQANPLIETCREMTLNEGRLFYLALTVLKPQLKEGFGDKEFKEVVLPASEVIKAFGNSKYYKDLIPISKGLQEKMINIRKPDGSLERINIFSNMEFSVKNHGGVKISFNPQMAPYLLELYNKPYTKIAAKHLFCLSSTYATKLLELMLEYQNIPNFKKMKIIKRKISIADMRKLFGIDEAKYKNIGAFKSSVIDTPIREIKRVTSHIITYTPIKTGKKITGYEFVMKLASKDSDNQQSADTIYEVTDQIAELRANKNVSVIQNATETDSMRALLASYGVGKILAARLAKKYDEERIKNNIQYSIAQPRVRNLGAYISKAIENDYYSCKAQGDVIQQELLYDDVDIENANDINRKDEAINEIDRLIKEKKALNDSALVISKSIASDIIIKTMKNEKLSFTAENILKNIGISKENIKDFLIHGIGFSNNNEFIEQEENIEQINYIDMLPSQNSIDDELVERVCNAVRDKGNFSIVFIKSVIDSIIKRGEVLFVCRGMLEKSGIDPDDIIGIVNKYMIDKNVYKPDIIDIEESNFNNGKVRPAIENTSNNIDNVSQDAIISDIIGCLVQNKKISQKLFMNACKAGINVKSICDGFGLQIKDALERR